MVGDDHVVNGHVDNMACVSEPGTVLLSWCDDENDPQFEVSMKNLEILENTSDAKGRRLQVSYSLAAHVPFLHSFTHFSSSFSI